MTEDRSMVVRPDQQVRAIWVPINQCVLGCRDRMDCAAIERAYRKNLQIGDCQFWPPLVGVWDGDLVRIMDGRHELLALLALGRTQVLVAFLEDR